MSFAWYILLKILILTTIGSWAAYTLTKSKSKIKKQIAFGVFMLTFLVVVFTPIKLDNTVKNNQVLQSFDKDTKSVDIETKPRVEYKAQ